MPEVTLSGLAVLFDEEDRPILASHHWRVDRGYVIAQERSGGRRLFLSPHRLLLKPPGRKVADHINGDGLDNRRANLRIVTRQENLQNRRRALGTTGHRNVYRWPDGRFRVKLTVDYRCIHVGMFDNLEDAVTAAHEARLHHFPILRGGAALS